MTRPLSLFYTHNEVDEKDETFCNELDQRLMPLKRSKLVTPHSKRDIVAGDHRLRHIEEQLDQADLILLLISPSFVASEACYKEMARALERQKSGQACVIPIILREGDYQDEPFAALPTLLPRNGKSLGSWLEQDEAWRDVAAELRRIAEAAQAAASSSVVDLTHPAPPATGGAPLGAGPERSSDPPDYGYRQPPLDQVLDEMKARVEAALQKSRALVSALVSRGYGSGTGDDSLRRIACALVDSPAKTLATDLAVLADKLPRDRELVRGLLWQILPFATDWRGLLSQARAANSGSAIELPLSTETVAEIVLAGVHGRCCLFAPGDDIPRGVAYIPLPASAYVPFFDPHCDGLVDAVLCHLYEEQNLAAPVGTGTAQWRRLRQRYPQYPRFKIAAKGVIKGSPIRRAAHYMLVIDDDFDPQQTRDLDGSWAIAKAALAAALPGLRLVRLTGGEQELENEHELVPLIKDVRDLS